MRLSIIALLFMTSLLPGQMEKRQRVLYDREAFKKLSPAVGAQLSQLVLRDLDGKPVELSGPRKKPLVIIGGAYT